MHCILTGQSLGALLRSLFAVFLFSTLYDLTLQGCGTWKSLAQYDAFKDKPVFGGIDYGGRTLYVCRSKLRDHIILPGKLRPDWQSCITSYNGGEVINKTFDVLVDNEVGSVSWQKYEGIIPESAIIGGVEKLEPLYVGKCTLSGKFTNNATYYSELTGKIHYFSNDSKFVYVAFGGVEFKCRTNMTILVCNDGSVEVDPRDAK